MKQETKELHARLIELRDHAEMASHLVGLLRDLSGEMLSRDPQSALADQINHMTKRLEQYAEQYGKSIHARLGAIR